MTVLTKTVRTNVVRPIDKLDRLKRNVRESLRRSRNRLDRAYPGRWFISSATSSTDIGHAFSDLSALHHARSQMAKEIHPDALRGKSDSSFLLAAVTALAERGGACIYRLLVDSRAIAALLVLRTAECSYFLISGMSEQSWNIRRSPCCKDAQSMTRSNLAIGK